jgi:hypothetical protein
VRYFFRAFSHIFHKSTHPSMIKSIGDFISMQKNSLSRLCVILEGFARIFLQIVVFVWRINACRVYDKNMSSLKNILHVQLLIVRVLCRHEKLKKLVRLQLHEGLSIIWSWLESFQFAQPYLIFYSFIITGGHMLVLCQAKSFSV